MTRQPGTWTMSDDQEQAVQAARSRSLTPAFVLRMLAGSPAAGLDAVRMGLDGARRGLIASNGLHSLLDAERVHVAVPDVGRGAGWYSEDGFLEALREVLLSSHDALELGCGAGRISRHVAPKVGRLTCTDVSRLMIRDARRALAEYPNVSCVRTDGYTLSEFADKSFDVVFAQGVLGYFELNPALAMLAEVARVLRPGGQCVFNFQCIDDPQYAAAHVELVSRFARRRAFPGGLDRPYSLAQLKTMYEAVGLNVVDVPAVPPGQRTIIVATR